MVKKFSKEDPQTNNAQDKQPANTAKPEKDLGTSAIKGINDLFKGRRVSGKTLIAAAAFIVFVVLVIAGAFYQQPTIPLAVIAAVVFIVTLIYRPPSNPKSDLFPVTFFVYVDGSKGEVPISETHIQLMLQPLPIELDDTNAWGISKHFLEQRHKNKMVQIIVRAADFETYNKEKHLSEERIPIPLKRKNRDEGNTNYQVTHKNVPNNIETNLQKYVIVDHTQLFGVDKLLKDLEKDLHATDRWIISLAGDGGVGKTALAYEAALRYAVEAGITRLAWVSAKNRIFHFQTGVKEPSDRDIRSNWATLLREAANQLEIQISENPTLWISDFQERIHALPSAERCLIIIDNFETVRDAQTALEYIDSNNAVRIAPHKVLLTTRHSVRGETQNTVEHAVKELSESLTYEFIHSLARGDEKIIDAPNEELKSIWEITLGNPFLIKLIIGRYHVLKNIQLILTQLKGVMAQKSLQNEATNLNGDTLSEQVKDYLYSLSFKELQDRVELDVSKKLIRAFCANVPGRAFSREELYGYSGIEDKQVFENALILACNLSLIRSSGFENPHYSIHSLLWHFICGSS